MFELRRENRRSLEIKGHSEAEISAEESSLRRSYEEKLLRLYHH